MAELFLKNSTGATIEVADLGLVIDNGQSITIDENDFDGYLTPDMVGALDDNPNNGLVLSTTDIGDTSGDLPKLISEERITMKTHWKPSRDTFADLPTIGNEEGDIRFVEDEAKLYRWNTSGLIWEPITSTFSLSVEDDEGDATTNVEKMVFVTAAGCECNDVYVAPDNTVYIGAPDGPNSMDATDLVISGTTLYSGGLPQNNVNYKPSDPAGSIVNYIIRDGIFSLSLQDPANRADQGDQGTISVYLNGTAIATLDLGANFQEANREGSQVLSNYDIQGSGDPVVNGRVDFTGTAAGKGHLQLLSVEMYNSFKFWQKWNAEIEITDSTLLRQGWNEIYITHEGISVPQTSNHLDLFYDTDSGADPSVTTPTVTEDTPVYSYLSGVRFYGTGSSWDVDVSGNNCFNNVYHASEAPLEFYGWPGLSTTAVRYDDPSVGGVSPVPQIGESMSISNWDLVQQPGVTDGDAQITVRPRDPYGTYTPASSTSSGILIFSWGAQSTDLVEYFRDENYRLPAGQYDTIPGSITGLWDSTGNLDGYDDGNGLQVYLDELYFPTIDFSSSLPTGNPDYSGLASESNKTYTRAFRHLGTNHSNGKLQLGGITKAQLLNREVRVWIKAPTQTGWLDLTRDYNFATFTGVDDDGCWVNRDIQINDEFEFTLDTFGTENSGYMIIVRVEYPDSSAPRINHMEVTNW